MRARIEIWLGRDDDGRWHAESIICTGDSCNGDNLGFGWGDVASAFAKVSDPIKAIASGASELAKALDNPAGRSLIGLLPGGSAALESVLAASQMVDMAKSEAEQFAQSLGKKLGQRALRDAKKLRRGIERLTKQPIPIRQLARVF